MFSQSSINKIAWAIIKIAPNILSNTLSKATKLHGVQSINPQTKNQIISNTKNLSSMIDKRLVNSTRFM
jgi:hypothetical protein